MAGDEVFQLGVDSQERDILWTTNNPQVAYANECGLIVAMGNTGMAVISATLGDETVNCNVIVSAKHRAQKVKSRLSSSTDVKDIEPTDIKIESISENPKVVNVRLYPIGACTVLNWTSSDDSVIGINNGLIDVFGQGYAELTVETENGLSTAITYSSDGFWTGVSDVVGDDNGDTTYNVYDMTGRCVLVKATSEQIKTLNKGLYLINGKKYLIKQAKNLRIN